jgi:hypothetical protein
LSVPTARPGGIEFFNLRRHYTASLNEDVIIGPIGSERVKDFSVIGNGVNLAAAFEYEARGGKQVLVDQPRFIRCKVFIRPILQSITS